MNRRAAFWAVTTAMFMTMTVIGLAGGFQVADIPFVVEVGDEVLLVVPATIMIQAAEPHDTFERTITVTNTSDNAQDVLVTLEFEDGGGVSADISPSAVRRIEPGGVQLYHAEVEVRGDVAPGIRIEGRVLVERIHVD